MAADDLGWSLRRRRSNGQPVDARGFCNRDLTLYPVDAAGVGDQRDRLGRSRQDPTRRADQASDLVSAAEESPAGFGQAGDEQVAERVAGEITRGEAVLERGRPGPSRGRPTRSGIGGGRPAPASTAPRGAGRSNRRRRPPTRPR